MKNILPLFLLACFPFLPPAFSQAGLLDSSFSDDGKVITPFPVAGSDKIFSLAVQPDQKILAAGNARGTLNMDFGLARYLPDGSLDTDFGTGGRVTTDFGSGADVGKSVVVQNDGKILVAGYAVVNNVSQFALARFLENGELDSSFGVNGRQTTVIGAGYSEGWSVALQADGKIVVAGTIYSSPSSGQFALVRYDAQGLPDMSFGVNGQVIMPVGSLDARAQAVVIQPNGKIIAGGYALNGSYYDFALVQYHPDGSVDSLFGTNGYQLSDFSGFDDQAQALVLQEDGKIVAGGWSKSGSGLQSFGLARYLANGQRDSTFGANGITKLNFQPFAIHDAIQALAVQADGKIIACGYSYVPVYEVYNFALARFLPNGQLDLDFNGTGKVATAFQVGNDQAYAVAIQADGRIVAGGGSASGDFALARYLPGSVVSTPPTPFSVRSVFLYPNPVMQAVKVAYTLQQAQTVSIALYDQNGKMVIRLIQQLQQTAGRHTEDLRLPEGLSAGLYFLELATPSGRITLKMVK